MPISDGVSTRSGPSAAGAGQVHPRAPGRHGRVPPEEPPRQQDAAQHRPARRHRPRRRRGVASPRPGHESQFTFKALNQGLYVYHCATAPVGMHVANGMYGLILVEPPGGPAAGRPRVLRDAGRLLHGRQVPREGPAALRHGEGHRRERRPTCCSTAPRAARRRQGAQAKAGETRPPLRRQRRPEPASQLPRHRRDLRQGLLRGRQRRCRRTCRPRSIPSGGAAIVEFKLEVPGTYMLVDHSIFRAFNKGALAC